MRAMTGTGRRWCGLLAGAAFACAGAAAPVSAEDPMAAIDWLRETLVAPELGELHPVTPPEDADDDAITMRPLDQVRPDAVGLFPAERVGLARDFWGPRTAGELAPLVAALPVDTLPALRVLAYRLLLAEFEAPAGADETEGSPLLAARIDKLYEYGALDQALAVLETLDSREAGMKLRWLEIALLLGDEEPVCARVLARGTEFPFEPGRIYCLARSGDWDAAEEAWDAAEDGLPEPYDALLARFLEVEGHYEAEPFAPGALPAQLSPLAWRIMEAIGEPVATHGLPVAFAHADLRGTIGWRAQIEAAERLVRTGALSPNRLLGLYTERAAAASGGMWDRVRAVQRLDDALTRRDTAAAGAALVVAWERMAAAELEPALAVLFAEALRDLPLEGEAADVARKIGYLSDDYEAVALDEAGTGARARLLAAVARGLAPDPEDARDPVEAAVAEAFGPAPDLPPDALDRLAEGERGAEVLRLLARIDDGSDPRMLGEGLALLRHLGFEDIARRAALQALILDRRG
jgi:hypothetical protein